MDSQPISSASVFVDTIFALSSGRLPAGVAIVRVSGPDVRFVVETIAGATPAPRFARHCVFRTLGGTEIDRGLVLFFPGPASFTGEDCAEFHLHGGLAVVSAMLSALGDFGGCRAAEAGEFTRRAFANGKLDLTEAEGLADLIAAETEAQRRLALLVASGAQHMLYDGWRAELIRGRALIEAELDFADEADVPGSVSERVWSGMADLDRRIRIHLAGAERAEIVRDGFKVVILGAPNAGKSSLLNRLAGREVAIVSDEAGTTRDLLEVRLDLGGIPVLLTDTAGLREAEGQVERIGIERARQRAASADLLVVLEDLTDPVEIGDLPADAARLRVGTKVDLTGDEESPGYDFVISTVSGYGIDSLLERLAVTAADAVGTFGDIAPTRQRHRDLLSAAAEEIDNAVRGIELPVELRAEHLRQASISLGRITGAVGVEDILDVVFAEFCIGK